VPAQAWIEEEGDANHL